MVRELAELRAGVVDGAGRHAVEAAEVGRPQGVREVVCRRGKGKKDGYTWVEGKEEGRLQGRGTEAWGGGAAGAASRASAGADSQMAMKKEMGYETS